MPISDTQEQTAHRQHPVPQNIMSVEFKLVGDLTVRQFVYLVVGGITVYLSFTSHLPFLWKWLFIFLGGFGGLSLAFVPFGDRGLDQWIKNFIRSISIPTQMIWKKTPALPQYFLSDYAHLLKSEVVALAPTKSRRVLAKYLEGIQKEELSEIDSKEAFFLDKLNFGLDIPDSLKSMVSVKAPSKEAEPLTFMEPFPTFPKVTTPSVKKEIKKVYPKVETKDLIVVRKPQDIGRISTMKNISVSRVLKDIPFKGEIILPRRGPVREKVYLERGIARDDYDYVKHKEILLRKAKELRETLKKAKQKLSPEGAVLPAQELVIKERVKKDIKDQDKNLSGVVETLKGENKRLIENLEALRLQMSNLDKTNRDYKERFSEYQDKFNKLEGERKMVLKSLEVKGGEKGKTVGIEPESQRGASYERPKFEAVPVRPTQEISKEKFQESSLKTKPNVVWGEVRDKNNKLLENATLIIRDEQNDPIRALKTNKLGQFISSTPFPDGTYSIEILNKENSFDIIKVALSKKVLGPINFAAKKQ